MLAVVAVALKSLSDTPASSSEAAQPLPPLSSGKAKDSNEAVRAEQSTDANTFIPAGVIKITASSEYESCQVATHLVDGSGMDGLAHDNDCNAFTMWQTGKPEPTSPAPGLELSPAWVRFDFTEPQILMP